MEGSVSRNQLQQCKSEMYMKTQEEAVTAAVTYRALCRSLSHKLAIHSIKRCVIRFSKVSAVD